MPFQICRVCYQRGYNLLSLKDEVHSYEKKLSSCIPEIDIYVIHNPGICRTCADMLDVAFKFRKLCLENEKRYNSTFVEGNKKSAIQISSKKESIVGENHVETLRHEIDANYDSPDLLNVLQVKTEFSSDYDKEIHNSGLHRQSQKLVDDNSSAGVVGNRNAMMLTFTDCNAAVSNSHELKSNKTHPKKSCHICKKTFDKENELNNHVKLHFIKCCGESFSTPHLLQLHTYEEHNMTCGICNENFRYVRALFNHVLDHVEVHWYKCNFCGKQFKTSVGLNEHTCQYYVCDFCSTIYFTKKKYNEHVKSHRAPTVSTKSEEILCEMCNKYYKTEALLLEHMSNEHVTVGQAGSNPFGLHENLLTCSLCGKEYRLKIHLKTHILQAHCNKILTIPVADCRKDLCYRKQEHFYKYFNILSKYLKQTKDINDLRKIKDLQRNFKLLSHYLARTKRAHVVSDQLITRFIRICLVCNVMYTTVGSFYAHIKTNHSSCCNREFKSIELFLQHNFTHYDEAADFGGDGAEFLCLRCANKQKGYTASLLHKCGDFRRKIRNLIMKRKNLYKSRVKEIGKIRVYLTNKWKTIESSATEGNANTRCTIELHESDSSDQYEPVMNKSDNSNRLTCEICREQFDCKAALLDHVTIHI